MPITFQRVTHTYHADSPFSYAALKGIDLEIPLGKVTAIIGETGSGKSTLVQHLNALLLPTEAFEGAAPPGWSCFPVSGISAV